jgi:hypothetical protein
MQNSVCKMVFKQCCTLNRQKMKIMKNNKQSLKNGGLKLYESSTEAHKIFNDQTAITYQTKERARINAPHHVARYNWPEWFWRFKTIFLNFISTKGEVSRKTRKEVDSNLYFMICSHWHSQGKDTFLHFSKCCRKMMWNSMVVSL